MEVSIEKNNGGTGAFKNDALCEYDVFTLEFTSNSQCPTSYYCRETLGLPPVIRKNIPPGAFRNDNNLEETRVLTILTSDNTLVKKWCGEVLKASKTRSIPLIAGISIDVTEGSIVDPENNPYSCLQICVASHCLVYKLPRANRRYSGDDEVAVSKALCAFLSDPKLICVGVGIHEIARKLDYAYDLKLTNFMDIRSLAEKAMGPPDQMWNGYMAEFGLDRMVRIVLGDGWIVERPGHMLVWEHDELEKVKYLTVDAFLSYEMGFWFLGKPDDDGSSSSKSGKKNEVEKRMSNKVIRIVKKWSL